jgi:low temperature requirement protein LtrA
MSDRPVDVAEPRVSTFELFFDLVFVFAFTRITGSLADDTTWSGLGHAAMVFVILWWAWGAYAWLTNAVPTDERSARLVVLAAMAAMLVVALAVPTTFGDDGVVFGIGYLMVIALHALLFALSGDDPASIRRNIVPLGSINVLGAALLIVAGLADGTLQALLWVTAIVVTYAGPFITGVAGFTARPGHFVERHGLIVIIALGESIVAVGAAETGEIDAGLIVAGLVTVALAGGLWWVYFDEETALAEGALRRAPSAERSRLARDVFSYLHIPIVLGVVLSALGIKQTLAHSGDPLDEVAAVALGGGVALYFAALAAIRLRCRERPRPSQLAAAALAVIAIPLATEVPALATLAGLAAVTVAAALTDRILVSPGGTAARSASPGTTAEE